MIQEWTGDLIGKMHNNQVTYDDIAEKMGVGKAYISMILNGKRNPPDIQSRMETALDEVIKERSQ